MCSKQNSLLLNQHNGDVAPQDLKIITNLHQIYVDWFIETWSGEPLTVTQLVVEIFPELVYSIAISYN
jgi:hypothetical protein